MRNPIYKIAVNYNKILKKTASTLLKEAAGAEDVSSLIDKLEEIKSLDVTNEDVKNLIESSPITQVVNLIKKIRDLTKSDKGIFQEILDSFEKGKEKFTDPDERQKILDDISSKLSTALKVAKFV